MIYVALLRGVNVGGKNRVVMRQLAQALEREGFEDVSTYINSGNILFQTDKTATEAGHIVERVIKTEFSLTIKVLVRSHTEIQNIIDTLPDNWNNDDTQKCDVMFVWDSHDIEGIRDQLTIKPDIDDVKFITGTIIWRVDRDKVTRSGMMKLVGTDLYKHMTIRNSNTARTLHQIMSAMKSD